MNAHLRYSGHDAAGEKIFCLAIASDITGRSRCLLPRCLASVLEHSPHRMAAQWERRVEIFAEQSCRSRRNLILCHRAIALLTRALRIRPGGNEPHVSRLG